ncbi:MAG: ABC transporter ATP-binding protein [Oscillospiraceae bacterium]|jgi:putative ABC transport system ATP-binding protein|nr:ABC transporter ATP-binding protein [Oscillospiraceae bacterium]
MQPILQVKNLEKVYGGKGNVSKALNGVTFNVDQGEYVGVMGASGSGKTSLLNCVSTIDSATAGKIYIDGEDITALKGGQLARFRSHKLGFIFQEYNLLDTLTAFENIALALTIIKHSPKDVTRAVYAIAEKLSVTDILNKYPIQMSGGQRQRIASARAIVTDPSLVLADEPTGALDSKSAKALLESLRVMVNELRSTILMVTHDPFAASYCDRILFIRDGSIFTELIRGGDSRKDFFDKIIEVVAVLGGE